MKYKLYLKYVPVKLCMTHHGNTSTGDTPRERLIMITSDRILLIFDDLNRAR